MAYDTLLYFRIPCRRTTSLDFTVKTDNGEVLSWDVTSSHGSFIYKGNRTGLAREPAILRV